MKIVKILLLILAATGTLLVSQRVMARHAALLINADTGNVLYEMEANQAWYPASLTKLMTLYMTFSALESGRLRLSDHMTVSSHAARQPTSRLGLRTWDTITVEDAILAIIVRSANDAAVVLAERLAGNERQFAIKMTSTAHSLGMYGSHFMNATGLPHDWQTTTARDMALLAYKIIHNFRQYYSYFGVGSLYFNGREFNATNKFANYYPGAEGMKTGYTCGSGYNLVASASQNGKRLIGVVLGGVTSHERYDHMYSMMDLGFSDNYGSYRAKNINNMGKFPIGTPPYQLTCGHKPSSHYAFRNDDDDDDRPSSRYSKKIPRPSLFASPGHTDIEKIYSIKGNHTKVTSKPVMSKAQTKPLDKKVSFSGNKLTKAVLSGKGRTAANHPVGKTGKKAQEKVVAAKSNHHEKPGKPLQLARATSHGKGYYVPDSKTKKSASTASGKEKRFYNPGKASKPETKSKNKRNGKAKS